MVTKIIIISIAIILHVALSESNGFATADIIARMDQCAKIEKDAASSSIHKYNADLERLFEYLQTSDINKVTQNHLREY